MAPVSHKGRRIFIAIAVLAAVAVPALADKPLTALDKPISTVVTAIPIDFDRDNPERKEFGRLIFRGGLNLFAKSSDFGGYSALALDATGTNLLAISDAGTWLRADLDYDGRALKGLSNVRLGPLLGSDGKPLLDDQDRDSEGMTLVDGDTRQGTAYVSFERKHRIARYPFTADRFGPPTGTVPLPPATKRMDANRGIEAITMIRSGRLKGTLVAFSERLTDKSGNLTGWLIGGPTSRHHHPEAARRLRHHRYRGAARWRHRDPRAPVPLQRRHPDAHPPRRRERAQARRADPGRGAAGGD